MIRVELGNLTNNAGWQKRWVWLFTTHFLALAHNLIENVAFQGINYI